MMLILPDGLQFPQPESFSIHPGIRSNVRTSLNGKVWGRRTAYRDTLSLDIGRWLVEDALAFQEWMYQQSLKSWKFDEDAFSIWIERMPTGLKHEGFHGSVRFTETSLRATTAKNYAGGFSLDLQIIEYLDLVLPDAIQI